jgi:hypothetical protein
VKPSSKFAQKLRGLIWLKLASRTYSLNIEAPKLIANISAAAQPQLRGTPHASRLASGGASGSGLPVAGSTSSGFRASSGGVAANGCHASPRRTPHSWPLLTKPWSLSGGTSGP